MIIGLDIGGTKIHAISRGSDGTVYAQHVVPSAHGPAALVESLSVVIDRLISESRDATEPSLGSIGIGIPGAVDATRGVVSHAVNLGIDTLDLGGAVSDRYAVPTVVDNDVKVAALGAFRYYRGKTDSLAYINVGTGVAAAAFDGGRLIRGHDNVAGEIGHIPVDPAGEVCPCGQVGCIETIAGGASISRRLAALDENLDLVSLYSPAADGLRGAQEERERIVGGIVSAIKVVTFMYGSEVVVLGGGVAMNLPGLRGLLRDAVRHEAGRSDFLRSLAIDERITVIPPDVPIGAMGAAQLAML